MTLTREQIAQDRAYWTGELAGSVSESHTAFCNRMLAMCDAASKWLDVMPRPLKHIAKTSLVILPAEYGFEVARHYKNGWETYVMGYSLDEECQGIPLSSLPLPSPEGGA